MPKAPKAPTFLDRMQPAIASLADGQDKQKLLSLITLQDTLEREDAHPKDRARARQQLLHATAPERARPRTP